MVCSPHKVVPKGRTPDQRKVIYTSSNNIDNSANVCYDTGMSNLSKKPTAVQNRRRHLAPLAALTTTAVLLGGGLLLKSEKGPEGTCIVPVTADIAKGGLGNLASDLGADTEDMVVKDQNGTVQDGSNSEMERDLSDLWGEDVSVPKIERDEIVIVPHIGEIACGQVKGDFTPDK